MSKPTTPVPYGGQRNPRLVTRRRGGLLDDPEHRALAQWAADCADHVLGYFTAARPDDDQPSTAIETARRWARAEVTMTAAREAAYAAHAAARETDGAAADAARAAGHAAATAHMADHELGPAYYALKAVAKTFPGDDAAVERERRWQIDQLPPTIAELVIHDMQLRSVKFRGGFRSGAPLE